MNGEVGQQCSITNLQLMKRIRGFVCRNYAEKKTFFVRKIEELYM